LGGCGAETKDRASQPNKLPLIASIHWSAWNRYSRKFISKILHSPGPVPLESPSPDTCIAPAR
jgi:hypothetical protein